MFCECHHTVNWKDQIFQKIQIGIPEHKDFLFGSMDLALNAINSIIKFQIWYCRFHGKDWCLPNIVQELKVQIQAEANHLNNNAFDTKWENYISILEI